VGVLKFTVDAKLLSELGERLVGRPHIALAELIKNSYDADARHVELTFDEDVIRIVDDGHGMNQRSFKNRWMRVGTTAKVSEQVSPALNRPLTGSKGVGRLSAQLLAHRLDLHSVALSDPSKLSTRKPGLEREIRAGIDWPNAQKKNELTDVEVEFGTSQAKSRFAANSAHGTFIELSDLASDWTARAFEDLAREIWALQPPFAPPAVDAAAFSVTLKTPFESVQESFDAQMTALMDIASATIVGKLLPPGSKGPRTASRLILEAEFPVDDEDGGESASSASRAKRLTESVDSETRLAHITVRLVGSLTEHYVVEIPDCQLHGVEFEIRIFDLINRQPKGIKVPVARRYLASFGGVHLYDSNFRLPYYGPDVDWLRLELDHARRLSRSRLLPDALQVKNAMQDLPSNKRVFGTVNISTAAEQRAAAEHDRRPEDALAIQITRDRLVDNQAFEQLTRTVRLSVDLYALARAKAKVKGVAGRRRKQPRPDPEESIKAASDLVETLQPKLPADEYAALRSSIDAVAENSAELRREAEAYSSLLGALATAGMTSLAYEHEVSKQRREVQGVARRLERLSSGATKDVAETLNREAQALREWSKRAKRIRALFAPLLSEETRTTVESYDARKLSQNVADTMKVLSRGTEIDLSGVQRGLMLPPASYAAWVAVLQNLLTNAFRATLDESEPSVRVDAAAVDGGGWLRVQNNGVAIDLADADRFFLPFEREDHSAKRSEALGLGGSGLGLTIVRMIADEIGIDARFEEPQDDWSTSIRIKWKDKP